MPRFEPFRGLRYDTTAVDLAAVTAPPYDVIDVADRAALAARDPYNAVHVDLPDPTADDPYARAAELLSAWRAQGVLALDPGPAFYGYGMDYRDGNGHLRHTDGVIGALELSAPGEGGILPHEHTTPKAKSDRLDLLRATGANLSAIWGLSPASGLADAGRGGREIGAWQDDDGVTHRLSVIDDPEQQRTIADLVSQHPVVIADGHHRYETALAYRNEQGESPGGAALTMTYLVELAEDEITVEPIHRLLRLGSVDLPHALDPWFVVKPADSADVSVRDLERLGCLGLVLADGDWLLEPRPELLEVARDLDTSRLDVALEALTIDDVRYQHGADNVRRAVATGDADAGVLVRPVQVDQILDIANGGERMPPKTTFFWPKLRTGIVFRPVD